MTITAPAVAAPRAIHNPVQQDTAIFHETVAETGGTRTLLEIHVAPGGGNEPHVHLTYAERFEVLEGTLAVRAGDAWVRLGPGETVTAHARTVHCFRNETGEPVRALVELTPGHRGFERALQVGYGLAADGRVRANGMPRNVLHLAVLGEWSDIRVVGPERMIVPVLGLLTRLARRLGVDAELERRYVRF